MAKNVRLPDRLVQILADECRPFETIVEVLDRVITSWAKDHHRSKRAPEEDGLDKDPPQQRPLFPSDEKPALGKGRKQCPNCSAVLGSASKRCACGHKFFQTGAHGSRPS